MNSDNVLAPAISEAINIIRSFVMETTGKEATDAEIADALKRYFVLNEIKEHIKMFREAKNSA